MTNPYEWAARQRKARRIGQRLLEIAAETQEGWTPYLVAFSVANLTPDEWKVVAKECGETRPASLDSRTAVIDYLRHVGDMERETCDLCGGDGWTLEPCGCCGGRIPWHGADQVRCVQCKGEGTLTWFRDLPPARTPFDDDDGGPL